MTDADATIIGKCECEAVYEQSEIGITVRVEDSADRGNCGHELNAWRSNNVLSFNLVRNPTE